MKLLHTGDTHIGYTQYREEARKEDFINAFGTVVSDAIDKGVDGVIHTGDLFHKSRPEIGTLRNTFRELKRLQEHDIPFYLIVGNHDGTRDTQWSELIEELNIGYYLDYSGAEIGDVALYGQDHVSRNRRGELTYEFDDRDADVNILAAHGLFSEISEFGEWSVETIMEQSKVEFDAVLLGDDHTHDVTTVNSTVVTYCGSTERTAADQRRKRGYNIVTVDESGVDITHETLSTRSFRYIDFTVEEDTRTEDVTGEIESASIEEGDVIIVTLSGVMNEININSIERTADRLEALTVQVNDRRNEEKELDGEIVDPEDFDDMSEDPEITDEMDITQPDLTPSSEKLDTLVRDESVVKSNLKSKTEKVVEGILQDNDFSVESTIDNSTVDDSADIDDEQVTVEDMGGEEA